MVEARVRSAMPALQPVSEICAVGLYRFIGNLWITLFQM